MRGSNETGIIKEKHFWGRVLDKDSPTVDWDPQMFDDDLLHGLQLTQVCRNSASDGEKSVAVELYVETSDYSGSITQSLLNCLTKPSMRETFNLNFLTKATFHLIPLNMEEIGDISLHLSGNHITERRGTFASAVHMNSSNSGIMTTSLQQHQENVGIESGPPVLPRPPNATASGAGLQEEPPNKKIKIIKVQDTHKTDAKMDPRNPEGCKSIWVGNVMPSITQEQLEALFETYGTVKQVRLLEKKHCAFVNYETKEAAGSAMYALQHHEIDGVKLILKFPDRGGNAKPGSLLGGFHQQQFPNPNYLNPAATAAATISALCVCRGEGCSRCAW